MAAPEPEQNPEVEDLLREGRRVPAEPLERAQLRSEALVGGAFLLAAIPLAILLPGAGSLQALPTIAFVLTYAVATRTHFELAQGHTDPTLLVLVPMLFGMPPGMVPLFVTIGALLGGLPDHISGKVHPSRAVFA